MSHDFKLLLMALFFALVIAYAVGPDAMRVAETMDQANQAAHIKDASIEARKQKAAQAICGNALPVWHEDNVMACVNRKTGKQGDIK